MSVTSTTLAGVNVWQFSGAVTDAEIKTAWSALVINGRYQPGRYIYLDSTCDMRSVRGAWYVDCQALGFILHLSRNKTNTTLTNWFIVQTAGLSVTQRANFVRFSNGTTITTSSTDGLDMSGGAMIYDVQGNPGGGDPRYLNEMMFGSLDGTLLVSQAYTEQELQPTSFGGVWRGIRLQKCASYPILSSGNHVLYRCQLNTETSVQLVRPYSNASVCYVSSTARRNGNAITTNLIDSYASTATVIMLLNNWRDESWFGASKTSLPAANWNAGNRVIGGVLKKIQTQPGTLVNVYDSRSTTAPQKSTFSETTSDFLSGTTGTTTDASTGKATFVVVGAIATGGAVSVTRYTGQQFTLQKFGYRVMVQSVDMTTGDDDLSAFSPITMTAQAGITRTQAQIAAATSIDTLQQLMEELHVLAIGLAGSAGYGGSYSGNLFDYAGGILTTSFASVTVDPSAASKISFNAATNSLTIKSTTLAGDSTVSSWANTTGPITIVGAFTAPITGNVTQATPTNLSGVTITGNLTYNTNTPITITLTNCTITGTVSNTGTGAVSVNLVNSTVTTGANVTAQYPITISDADNRLTSIHAWVFNALGALVYDTTFQSQVASVTVNMPVGGSLRVYSQPYGYISRITSTSDTSPTLKISHIPEALVDTTLDVTVRNEIESHFSSVLEDNIVYVETDADFKQYTPAQVLNGMHYFIVNRGFLFSASSLAINSVDSVRLIDGGFRVYSAGFRGRAKSTLNATNTPSLSITLPLYIEDATGVTGNQVLVRNANGIAIVSALWTKATANISNNDINSIATRVDQSSVLAKEATLAGKSSQSSVSAIPTNPVLATDTRLDMLDAMVSSRLAAAAYTAPANADIAAIKSKTDTLVNGPTLAQIEGSTVLARATAVAAIPTNPVLTTDTRLDKLDATVSSRLATSGYSAPSAAQNAAAVRVELATELGRVDAPISSRSTLTAQDIPQGLTAAQVWANASRTLTVAAGMTAEQEAALLATRDSALHTQTVVDGMSTINGG